jgi:ankyrin repeat domain-containing protein 6
LLDSSVGGISRSVELLDSHDVIIHRACSDRGSVNSNEKNHPESENGHKTISSFYNSDKDQLSSTGQGSKSKTPRDSSLSEREWCSISEKEAISHGKPVVKLPKHRKNVDRKLYTPEKCIQTLDTGQKGEAYDSDHDSIGSLEFDKVKVTERLEQLLTKTRKILDFEKLPSSKKKPDSKKYFRALEKIRKLEATKYDYELDLAESLDQSSIGFGKHDNIAEEMEKITKSLLMTHTAAGKEEIPISPEISKDLLQYKENQTEEGAMSSSQQQSSGRSSRNKRPQQMFTGFYTNSEFDDIAPSSSSNTIKSQTKKAVVKAVVEAVDLDDSAELSEMADLRELNDLKSRILNGTNWRSQVLKKTAHEINHSNGDATAGDLPNGSVNGVTRKYDIKSSEIKTLKAKDHDEVDGEVCPLKVKDIISKFQGLQSPGSTLSESRDKWHHQQSTALNDGHEENTDSESSEDESETEEEVEEEGDDGLEPLPPPPISGFQNGYHQPAFNAPAQRYPVANYQNVPYVNHPEPEAMAPPPLMPKSIIDPRLLIPKDAYFHELPGKQVMRPSQQNGGYPPYQPVPVHLGGRNRNPIPVDLNDAEIANTNTAAMVAHSLSYSHHSSVPLDLPQFQQYSPVPHPHQIYHNYPPPILQAPVHHPIIAQQPLIYNRPPLKIVPQKEKLLSNRKFGYSNLVDMELTRLNPSETSSAEGSTSTTFSNHLQLLDQVQYERDKNNDSGYSTKICGSSQGASPSLSGHMDSIELPDSVLLSHHHHQPSMVYNGHHHHNHNVMHQQQVPTPSAQLVKMMQHGPVQAQQYLSNIGSSSLV